MLKHFFTTVWLSQGHLWATSERPMLISLMLILLLRGRRLGTHQSFSLKYSDPKCNVLAHSATLPNIQDLTFNIQDSVPV